MKPVGMPQTLRPLPTQDPCATLQSIQPASLEMRLLWMEPMTSSNPLLIMGSEEVPVGPLPCGLKHRPQISPSSSTERLVLPHSSNYRLTLQEPQCWTLEVQAMPSQVPPPVWPMGTGTTWLPPYPQVEPLGMQGSTSMQPPTR